MSLDKGRGSAAGIELVAILLKQNFKRAAHVKMRTLEMHYSCAIRNVDKRTVRGAQ